MKKKVFFKWTKTWISCFKSIFYYFVNRNQISQWRAKILNIFYFFIPTVICSFLLVPWRHHHKVLLKTYLWAKSQILRGAFYVREYLLFVISDRDDETGDPLALFGEISPTSNLPDLTFTTHTLRHNTTVTHTYRYRSRSMCCRHRKWLTPLP